MISCFSYFLCTHITRTLPYRYHQSMGTSSQLLTFVYCITSRNKKKIIFLFHVPIRYLGKFKTFFPSIITLPFNYTYNVQFPIFLLFIVASIILLPSKRVFRIISSNQNITVIYLNKQKFIFTTPIVNVRRSTHLYMIFTNFIIKNKILVITVWIKN